MSPSGDAFLHAHAYAMVRVLVHAPVHVDMHVPASRYVRDSDPINVLACLLACWLACLPACLPVCLLACLHFLLACLLACLFGKGVTCSFLCLHVCLLAWLGLASLGWSLGPHLGGSWVVSGWVGFGGLFRVASWWLLKNKFARPTA